MRRHLQQLILQWLFLQVFLQQRFGLIGILPQAEGEHEAALIAIDQADRRLHGTAGVHAGAHFSG
ncbi:hypothetical protein D3C72_2509710 [compost metagenome]